MFFITLLGLSDWLILGLLGVVVLYCLTRVVIIPKTGSCIVERFGAYRASWFKGIHYRLPFLDHLKKTVDFQGKSVWLIPMHEIIKTYFWPVLRTKNGISATMSLVVQLQIVHPKLYVYGASSPPILIERLATNTVINLFAAHEWGDFVTDRFLIQTQLLETLQDVVNPWGIRINRIQIGKLVPEELSSSAKYR